METKFNFNSAICTSKEQSELLLALGLKKETADMYYEMKAEGELPRIMPHTSEIDYFQLWDSITPAWSLHRLIEMMPRKVEFPLCGMPKDFHFEIHNGFVRYYNGYVCCVMEGGGYYKGIIDCIEWLIKEGYFNKEYLVDKDTIEERCKGVLEYLDYIREED